MKVDVGTKVRNLHGHLRKSGDVVSKAFDGGPKTVKNTEHWTPVILPRIAGMIKECLAMDRSTVRPYDRYHSQFE
ncbi:hypothetical protein PIB30_076619 [Stylosanthes scabra]|uniref:Uncharacterized protein n=1 Tax=Stylosanthes scabra TaxID=79078 RepID=A0ABU6UP68_9FABA|nr:hypothetical protein [Stylosanthes scabra]